MSLPAATEKAAAAVAGYLAALDRQVADHLTDGTSLPTIEQVMDPIHTAIVAAVTAALKDTTTAVTTRMVTDAVNAVEVPVRRIVSLTLRQAARAGRDIPSKPPPDPGLPASELRRLIGAGAALLVLLARDSARRGRRRKPDVATVRRLASTAGVKPPRITASYGRMLVRTEVAVARNKVAVTVARQMSKTVDDGTHILVKISDGGPCDYGCQRLDGKWATIEWFEANPISHPNCVRNGRPQEVSTDVRASLTGARRNDHAGLDLPR